jgi:hypothetical protein
VIALDNNKVAGRGVEGKFARGVFQRNNMLVKDGTKPLYKENSTMDSQLTDD